VTRRCLHLLQTLGRWAVISSVLSALLFLAAGSTRISSLRAYLLAFSTMLLITMLSVDPQLARERSDPGEEATTNHFRFLAGLLFLLTLTTAAFFVGRTELLAVAARFRWAALAIFVLGSSLQAWAMIANPFFSPVVRLQTERGHRLIACGPYKFVRHPGYLAMCVSAISSAIAIGSYIALLPALVFVFVIHRRARLEDAFLKVNLAGFALYAERVSAGLPFIRSS
jgi:protein-S-isoprenylcysteine O-methyltransferase Ste14